MTDATGTTIFTDKPDGHLWTEREPWASEPMTYDYNGAMKRSCVSLQQPGISAWTQTDLNASDRITRLDNPGGSRIENQYDSMARQTHTWLKTSGGVIRNHHGYNLAGHRTQQTKTSGNYVNYGYDHNGQLEPSNGYTPGKRARRSRKIGSPLQGLKRLLLLIQGTQGDALGWYGTAPLGRRKEARQDRRM